MALVAIGIYPATTSLRGPDRHGMHAVVNEMRGRKTKKIGNAAFVVTLRLADDDDDKRKSLISF
jgi:hypothetical protein